MRFKVDENLPRETCDLLNGAGHDAISVGQQGLGGADDTRIYQLSQAERRALITLDVDFANVQAYDPKSSAGGHRVEAGTAGPTAGARRRGEHLADSGA